MARFPPRVHCPIRPPKASGYGSPGSQGGAVFTTHPGEFPMPTGQQNWIDLRSDLNMKAIVGSYSSCAELIPASDPKVTLTEVCFWAVNKKLSLAFFNSGFGCT
jgi:hypothetical protein